MEDGVALYSVLIIICLFMSAFFSSTETALTSLTELKINHIIHEKGNKAKALELWLLNPNKVLNTILIGNNIFNILGSVLAAELANMLFDNTPIALVTGVMTLMVLIFGEITPKTFAKHNAETFSLFAIKILKLFYTLFYPVSYTLNVFVKVLIKFMGGEVEKIGPSITEDELEFLISVGEKEGVLEDQKREMLHNIFEISDTIAREVMVPRTDMTILKVDQPVNEIINVVSQTEYSRIPVYENKMDNIIGILYVKDLLKYIKEDFASIDIRKIMRKVYFVPETKKIDDLLREFQLNRIHLAVVVDEYGGVSGIVTLEDILEEIVGEIRDEYDKEDDDIVEKISEDEYIVRARMDVDDFCEFFEVEKSEDMDEYETLGGLIYDLAGKIPDVGDEFELDGYTLTVMEKESRKLKKIKIVRNNINEESEDEQHE